MKKTQNLLKKCALMPLMALGLCTAQAQVATWTGGGFDSDWNNSANWDIGVPVEGISAFIGSGNMVDYNAPMAATSFAALSSAALLNVNAGGFNVSNPGDGAIGIVGSGARFFINNGGAVSLTSGGLTLSNAAGLSVSSGGSLSVAGNFLLGRNGTGNTGFATNNGGTIMATATSVNPNNNSSTSLLLINGGTSDLGNVVVKRSAAAASASALGTEGFIISNGVVRMMSLDLGGSDGNSWLTMLVTGGAVTNFGDMTMRQATASRASRFLQTGGIVVTEGANGVNLRGHNANNAFVFYSVTGGTNIVQGFVLGNPAGTDTTGTVRLTNSAKIYIGSGGFTSIGTLNTKSIVLNSTGTFGAQADWSGTEPMIMAGGTFDAADLSGTPRNISISGVLSGSGALNKTGGGTLTLDAANTYSGNTVIDAGTLALGASGSIANSAQIIVGSGATFDVSAVFGYTVGGARTLSGLGNVIGDVALASSGVINPGVSPGTLTLANSLTLSGGGILHFDLPTTPGPGNDRLNIGGDLNVSGANIIEIVGGGSPGSVHALIQYGGNFNGTLSSFSLSGASGILSNNVAQKTIYLVVQSAIRAPGSVVWVGNPSVNEWDTANRTNWLNTATSSLDYFVTGDTARFDNTGASNPNVVLVGNNAPSTLTVDATANYTFGGGGAISGSATLIKTNSGTLTVTATNLYTGPTVLGGGVLVASSLAGSGAPSSIGAATADPANLVFDGGVLRYTGATVSTDRGATFNAGGGTLEITDAGAVVTASGSLTGSGVFAKSGPGALILPAANSYTGGTVISNGTVRVNVSGAAGTGVITNKGGTLLIGGAISFGNALHFEGTSTIDLNNVGGNTALNGAWSGDGTVNIINQQNSTRVFTVGGNGSGGGHLWNFSGTINMGANDGDLRFNDGGGTGSGPNFGSSNAVFNLGTGTARFLVRNGGTTTYLGAVLGGPNTRMSGRGSSSGIATYVVGGKNIDATFEGTIMDTDTGSGQLTAIIKQGTGKWTLTGNNTYTGNTTVEAGTLQVDGWLANTWVTVTGGTLAGSGTLFGPVDVQWGGSLSPGSSVGSMYLYNTLTLQSGSTNVVEIDKTANAWDTVYGLSFVQFGGTLVVSNLTAPLAAGDSFALYPGAGSYWGAFDEIIPATPGPGLGWDTSSLTVDGTLKVIATTVPQPAFNVVQRSGNDLILSGTNGPASGSYYVLTATNVALPLANWTPVATNAFNPDGSFSFTNAINATTPQRYFQLQVP